MHRQIQIRYLSRSWCHYWQKVHRILAQSQRGGGIASPKEGFGGSDEVSLDLVELARVLESEGAEADFPPNPTRRSDDKGEE